MKLGILTTLLLASSLALAQEATDLAAEPHYRLLLQNDQVQVFALTLHPDQSALVRFRRSFMTVALQDGEIIIWDEGKSPIQHFQVHKGETSFRCLSSVCQTPQQQENGVAGGYRNDRPNDYRNITVEFLDPNIGWNTPEGGTISFPASLFLGGAIVADVLLQPGDSFPAPEKRGAELVIAVSDLDLKAANGTRIRKSPGDVAWIPADDAAAVANKGRDPARFIIVEFHPDTPLAPVGR
ncbi:MAG TPA: hypothetical protein VJ999_01850 [Candidatus Sulfotelmatobacter sp.]|nr:hypothetical protein [Candidatus Sulfotelmatobacter sp.]